MKVKTSLAAFAALLLSITPSARALVYWDPAFGGNGHFYDIIYTGGTTWDAAKTAAALRGGHLATLTSSAENSFVWGLANSDFYWTGANDHGPWIGGSQPAGSAEPAGGWTWENNEGLVFSGYTSWAGGEPNDFDTGESRMSLWARNDGPSFWNDLPADFTGTVAYALEVEPQSVVAATLQAVPGEPAGTIYKALGIPSISSNFNVAFSAKIKGATGGPTRVLALV